MDPDVGEWIFEIGQVPSDRVLLAIAGIRRLASLLREDQNFFQKKLKRSRDCPI
jgi:hypothetical protein